MNDDKDREGELNIMESRADSLRLTADMIDLNLRLEEGAMPSHLQAYEGIRLIKNLSLPILMEALAEIHEALSFITIEIHHCVSNGLVSLKLDDAVEMDSGNVMTQEAYDTVEAWAKTRIRAKSVPFDVFMQSLMSRLADLLMLTHAAGMEDHRTIICQDKAIKMIAHPHSESSQDVDVDEDLAENEEDDIALDHLGFRPNSNLH